MCKLMYFLKCRILASLVDHLVTTNSSNSLSGTKLSVYLIKKGVEKAIVQGTEERLH